MVLSPVIELKDKILSLSVSHPSSCNQAIRKLMRHQAGLKLVATAFDSIGVEYAKQAFDFISPEQWKYLETRLFDTSSEKQVEHTLKELHNAILSEIMTRQKVEEKGQEADPFLFLKSLDEENAKRLLAGFNSVKISLIAAYWQESEMAKILRLIESDKRREVILQINRLHRLPDEFGLQAASSFAKELQLQLQAQVSPPKKVVTPPPFRKKIVEQEPPSEPITAQNQTEVEEAINRISTRASQKEERHLLEFIERESPELQELIKSKLSTLNN